MRMTFLNEVPWFMEKSKAKATRKDVAKKAGVAEETVSRILNNSRQVSEKTVKKVMAAIKELDYQPDMIARSMVKKDMKQIAFVVDDILNPYYGELLYGFENEAMEYGYFVSVCTGYQKFNEYINHFISRRYDGIYLSIIPSASNLQKISKLTQNNISVLLSGSTAYKDETISHLNPDLKSGISEAVEYLYKCGHRKIAMLNFFDDNYPYDVRTLCYKETIEKYIPDETPNIFTSPYTAYTPPLDMDAIKKLTYKLIDSGTEFSAVLCSSDIIAIGCMSALRERGYRVPDDISVVGIDDMIFSREMNPPLSSIGYDKVDFGRKAFKILLEHIKNGTTVDVSAKTNFISRESVKSIG